MTKYAPVGEMVVQEFRADDGRHTIKVLRADPRVWVSLMLLAQLHENEIASYEDGVLTVNAVNGTFRYQVDESTRKWPDTALATRIEPAEFEPLTEPWRTVEKETTAGSPR